MKILIFGGTTEGRILAEKLAETGNEVTVSCATPLGGEELRKIDCRVLCGRLDVSGMTERMGAFDIVADATHPYSGVVSANIREACKATEVPLRRVLRTGFSEEENCIQVRDCREAAVFLQTTEGNILLTTGSKELSDYDCLAPERLFARILPTHEGIAACEAIGLPHRNILALQGPFTQLMNEATMEQYQIRWIVTRNSGITGGFSEKIRAARSRNVGVVLVQRPEETGITMEEFLDEVKRACR